MTTRASIPAPPRRRPRRARASLPASDRRPLAVSAHAVEPRPRAMGATISRRAARRRPSRNCSSPRPIRSTSTASERSASRPGRHVRLALADADEIGERIEEVYRGEGATREPESLLEVQHLDNDHEGAPPLPGEERRRVDHASRRRAARRRHRRRARATFTSSRKSRASPCAIASTACWRWRARCRAPWARRSCRASRSSRGSTSPIGLRPQDGRARVAVNGIAVDLRVSTLPGVARREGRHPRARRAVDRADARRHGLSSRRARADRAAAPVARRADPRHRARPAPARRPRCTRRCAGSRSAA